MKPVVVIFFFNDTATTEIYTLSLHDALPICVRRVPRGRPVRPTPSTLRAERWAASTALSCRSPSTSRSTRSEEHTSELQSRQYLVCRLLLEKKKQEKSGPCGTRLHLLQYQAA